MRKLKLIPKPFAKMELTITLLFKTRLLYWEAISILSNTNSTITYYKTWIHFQKKFEEFSGLLRKSTRNRLKTIGNLNN